MSDTTIIFHWRFSSNEITAASAVRRASTQNCQNEAQHNGTP